MSYQQMSTTSSSQERFSQGDLVLCQYDAYPVWPAVIQVSDEPPFAGLYRRRIVCVNRCAVVAFHCYFPDDDSAAWIQSDLIVAFHASFPLLVRVWKHHPELHASQSQALCAASERHRRLRSDSAQTQGHKEDVADEVRKPGYEQDASVADKLCVSSMLGQWLLKSCDTPYPEGLEVAPFDYEEMLRDGRKLPHVLRERLGPSRDWPRQVVPGLMEQGSVKGVHRCVACTLLPVDNLRFKPEVDCFDADDTVSENGNKPQVPRRQRERKHARPNTLAMTSEMRRPHRKRRYPAVAARSTSVLGGALPARSMYVKRGAVVVMNEGRGGPSEPAVMSGFTYMSNNSSRHQQARGTTPAPANGSGGGGGGRGGGGGGGTGTGTASKRKRKWRRPDDPDDLSENALVSIGACVLVHTRRCEEQFSRGEGRDPACGLAANVEDLPPTRIVDLP